LLIQHEDHSSISFVFTYQVSLVHIIGSITHVCDLITHLPYLFNSFNSNFIQKAY